MTTADISVKNPTLGVVGLNLVEFRRGEWSYCIRTVNGETVFEGPDAEPMPKKDAVKAARRFGKSCVYIRGLGYCYPL